MHDIDEDWMTRALALAAEAAARGEVPVGALVVRDGCVLGQGYNRPILGCDPTAHAEVVAIREAARALDNYRLVDATLYVTIEPCTMCFGAMIHARIRRLVYGAPEPRAGVVESHPGLCEQVNYNHRMEIRGGVLAQQSSALLRTFFQQRRAGIGKVAQSTVGEDGSE